MFDLKKYAVAANKQYYNKIWARSAEDAAKTVAQSCKNGDIISVFRDGMQHNFEVLNAYLMRVSPC